MRARVKGASAARSEISLSGIQSAWRPSAGVRTLHLLSAHTRQSITLADKARVWRYAAVLKRVAAPLLATCAARTQLATNSLVVAVVHAMGMRARVKGASAARSEISLSGIQSALRPSAGVRTLHLLSAHTWQPITLADKALVWR